VAKRSGVAFVIWLVLAAGVAALIYINPARHRAGTVDAGRVMADASVVITDAAVAADAGYAEAVLDAMVEVDAPPAQPLYTITEALEDIASGPLKFVGTGEWFGNYSIHACAYRNERVIVVNEYCTTREQVALGLIVISPTRGHLKVYAEAEKPISTITRADYFTFRVEVEPPFEGIELTSTYAELRAWDELRYNGHVGGCWYENSAACAEDASPGEWGESAKAFITEPPAEFYRLTKDLHKRAVRDAR
jgi:hypothetical protein